MNISGLELYKDAKLCRAKAFEELENLLVEEELDEIYRSSKEFRKRFMFR